MDNLEAWDEVECCRLWNGVLHTVAFAFKLSFERSLFFEADHMNNRWRREWDRDSMDDIGLSVAMMMDSLEYIAR